jgi:hypothetical protein
MKVSEHIREAASERRAFNKFNVVELMSQLMTVLKKEGLDDAVGALKKVAPAINKSWMERDK